MAKLSEKVLIDKHRRCFVHAYQLREVEMNLYYQCIMFANYPIKSMLS